MNLNRERARKCLKEFDFRTLFIEELGWDRHEERREITVDNHVFILNAVAHKRGMVAYVCEPLPDGTIPPNQIRKKIEHRLAREVHEHLIIHINAQRTTHIWQWVKREPGKPAACREHPLHEGQSGETLLQRLEALVFTLEEEEGVSIVDVSGRVRAAFDVEKLTRGFFKEFKGERQKFASFLKGIPDQDLQDWYVSVMINRLMFIYFIQKKGFLHGDQNYLEMKLAESKLRGRNRYYHDFLCPLFFEGFAKRPEERSSDARKLLGEVPYLNGGIFQKHKVEQLHVETIEIPDEAFEKLFKFFGSYRWHLDERPLRDDREINPDVLGYIFEQYINQKQMGAYYTKEDITGYISQNTIIPRIFDMARERCKIAFEGEQSVWRLLQDDPDRYIYDAVRSGVVDDNGDTIPESALPDFVQKGMHAPKARMFNQDYNLSHAEIPGPGGGNLALPTETWREYIARRQRCIELRAKLRNGEVGSINDLITLNLDIRQFTQDVIETSESVDLVKAFWRAIAGRTPEKSNEGYTPGISILDPTCGSGAFLFAALNILEPLYEACLDRMQQFIDDLERSGNKHRATKLGDFKKVLNEVASHPNRAYFIYKSIILNNLFGVDIMDEAVEICKLRLFLKLVAQVDTPDKIEPLPDIDFNIRAGNTLVGFASLEDVRRTQEGTLGFAKKELERLEEEADVANRAFRAFRKMQTEENMSSADFAKAKDDLCARLAKLDNELDRFLAGEYGIDPKNPKTFENWKTSHKPFHWFAEFYGIVHEGGFDVIIGNPPWAEYSSVKRTYTVRAYETEKSGNLHAICTERSLKLRCPDGSLGFIVQLPLTSSSRMSKARSALRANSRTLHVLPFDDRPGKLFDGLQHCRSVILVSRQMPAGTETTVLTNRYQRWATEVRPALFQGFTFTEIGDSLFLDGCFPKLGSPTAESAFAKLPFGSRRRVRSFLSARQSTAFVFYQEATGYWVKAVVGVPYYAKNGEVGEPAHGRYLYFDEAALCYAAMALLNSSLFYAYFIAYGDCFHLSQTLVTSFPVVSDILGDARLALLGEDLDHDLRDKAEKMSINTRAGDKISYDEFFAWKSKPIIDEIDIVLAEHYGFTDEELDFIVNYDIKYRMGKGSGDQNDD